MPEANMSDIPYRLIYTSARHKNCTEDDIQEILAASHRNNAKSGITGVLLYTDDRFLQVLEGQKEALETVYEKIKKDPRHGGCMIRYFEPSADRYFDNWNMGGKEAGNSALNFKTQISPNEQKLFLSILEGDKMAYQEDGMRLLKRFMSVA